MKIMTGICDRCGQKSEELKKVIDKWFCPSCSRKDMEERIDFEISIRRQG
jgi:hypothetical protein